MPGGMMQEELIYSDANVEIGRKHARSGDNCVSLNNLSSVRIITIKTGRGCANLLVFLSLTILIPSAYFALKAYFTSVDTGSAKQPVFLEAVIIPVLIPSFFLALGFALRALKKDKYQLLIGCGEKETVLMESTDLDYLRKISAQLESLIKSAQ